MSKLKEIRVRHGLTQDKLAEISNVPRICIARYEAEQYQPSMANAVKLARALDVSIEELLGQTEQGESA